VEQPGEDICVGPDAHELWNLVNRPQFFNETEPLHLVRGVLAGLEVVEVDGLVFLL
jgi:hypothetical protein